MRRSLIATAVMGMTAAVAAAFLAPAASATPSQFFQNCDEAIGAGFTDVRAGDPAYRPELDGDSDGIACELDDPATTAAAPAPPPEPTAPVSDQAPPAVGVEPPTEVQGATADRSAAQDELAQTGVSTYTPVIAALALALFLAGHWFMRAGYERLDWLPTRQPDVRYTVERVKRRKR